MGEYVPQRQLTLLPKRPALGNSGKKTTVKVNIFPVTAMRDAVVYLYDIKIAAKGKLPAAIGRGCFRQFEVLMRSVYPASHFVYDGTSLAYSSTEVKEPCSFTILADKNMEIDIPPLEQDQRGGGGGGRGFRGGGRGGGASSSSTRPDDLKVPTSQLSPIKVITNENTPNSLHSHEKITMTLKMAGRVSMHELLLHAAGKQSETDSVIQASNAISCFLHYLPSILYTPVGPNFFSPVGRTPIANGLEVWRGFHQSTKALLAGHLGINVDVASTVFRTGSITVLEYLCKVFNLRSQQDIAGISFTELLKALKGVSVVTTHRGDQKQRFKIGSISKLNSNTYKFEKSPARGESNVAADVAALNISSSSANKKKVSKASSASSPSFSVADYFWQEYKYRLHYPNLPLALKPNGKTAFPLEVLSIVPAQRVTARLNAMQTADMIKVTCQTPSTRRILIEKAVKTTLAYQVNPYLKSIGLEISNEMMSVPARILPSPKVVFRGNSSLNASDGSWNLRNQKLVSSPPISALGFVFFVRIDTDLAIQVRDQTLKAWSGIGMSVGGVLKAPVVVCNPAGPGVRQGLQSCFAQVKTMYKRRPDLIVCVISKDVLGVYEQIKVISLTEAGFVTQCMLWSNLFRGGRLDIRDQYIQNVALKANIKCGGASNIIDRELFADGKPTMFVGIDVTHPAPGSLAPSIAALAVSMDSKCTVYQTFLIQNQHRQELVEKIGEVVVKAVKEFKKKNASKPPFHIIIFRDGVSTGQFRQVLDVEIQDIKKSLLTAFNFAPKISCIVVQKRHHIRLFPIDASSCDRSGNCLPGTVIDSTITHPLEYNFVLQSHAGLQGTSRPTVYHVILDENNFGSDAMQQLCFNLCFLSERATKSINMVAPCYRAHIAAFYARMFIASDAASSSAISSSSGGGGGGSIGSGNLLSLNEMVSQSMYYM